MGQYSNLVINQYLQKYCLLCVCLLFVPLQRNDDFPWFPKYAAERWLANSHALIEARALIISIFLKYKATMADVLSLKESILVYLDISGALHKLMEDCKSFNGTLTHLIN